MALLVYQGNTLHAVEVEDLYVAEVRAGSQNASERREKAELGLRDVVVRVTGSDEALAHPVVRASLNQPEVFIQQFSYFTRQSPEGTGNGSAAFIRFQFDPSLVDRMLRQAGQSIWGTNRPNILVWLVQEENRERQILASADESVLKTALVEHAKRRGLPVFFPLMDLQDELALSTTDAWGQFKDRLEAASARYQPQGILSGRLYQMMDGSWTGRWLFIFNDLTYRIDSSSSDLATFPDTAIDTVTEYLAKYYAVDTSVDSTSVIKLWVTGVGTLQAHGDVIDYLNRFALVADVAVSRVDKNNLLLRLTAEGNAQKLSEAIALDDKLVPEKVPAGNLAGDHLVFRWRP